MANTEKKPRDAQRVTAKPVKKTDSKAVAPKSRAEVPSSRGAGLPIARELGRSLLTGSANDLERTKLLRQIVGWAKTKWPDYIPDGAYAGEPFEFRRAGLHLESSFNAETGIWGARFEHLGDEGSTWVTEAMLAPHEDLIVLGVRNVVSRLDDSLPPLTMPRFLRECVDKGHFADGGYRLASSAIQVKEQEGVVALVRHLLNPDRNLPVVLITRTKGGTPAIPPDEFAREVTGLAHVVAINPDENFIFSEIVGTSWSAFNGSIRTYLPRMTFSDPLPRHKLILGHHIASYEGPEGTGAEGFRDSLKRQLFAYSVSPQNNWADFPTFAALRRKTALDAVKANRAGAEGELQPLRETLTLYETVNGELEAEVATWKRLAEDFSAANEEAEARVNELEAQVVALRHGLDEQRRSAGDREAQIEYPEDYAEMSAWVDKTYKGKLVLHQRAKRALKGAAYEEPKVVAEALDLLANHYRNSRIQTGDAARKAKQEFEQRCQELGIDVAKSISPTQAGEYERDYYVEYGPGKESRLLEWHLKKGSSRADRHCLRIYYFFDEDGEVVVVGSLPGHLTNQLT